MGIVDQMKDARSEKRVASLLERAGKFEFISPKTTRKLERIAVRKRAWLKRKQKK